jgi:predicted CXXCH cytochrome family protein
MRIDTMIRNFNVSYKLFRCSVRILILLIPCTQLSAEQLQLSVVKVGCLKYQDPKTIGPLKKFKEPALEKGCVACHLNCDQLPADFKPDSSEYYLKAKEPALCLECHNSSVKGMKDLSPAHDNQPLGNSKCSGCHDPHSSNSSKLMREFSHSPFKARLCSACHPKPESSEVRLITANGKGQLTAKDADQLCYDCHTDFKEALESTKSRHKLLSQSKRSCMECHDPHAGNQEYVLKKPAQDLCLSCHDTTPNKITPGTMPSQEAVTASKGHEDKSTQYLNLSSKYVHEPAMKSCLFCHDAHGSEFPKELRAPVRDLCMNCHGENSQKIIQSNQPFPLFGGLISLSPKTFEKLSPIDLSNKYVHEPANTSCVFCHDAHASGYPAELYSSVQDVCLACHGSNAEQIVRSEHPFPLFGGRVSLPPKIFKSLTQIRLVDGNLGHPTAKHPVYAKATADRPELTCVTCHASHSASTGPKLWVTQQETLCYSLCHKM